jgi:hypothetical protein
MNSSKKKQVGVYSTHVKEVSYANNHRPTASRDRG